MSLAFPKPSQIKKTKPHFREFADGRIVFDMTTKAGRDAYSANVRSMWVRQNQKCGLQISPQCQAMNGRLSINYAQFDHDDGRGSGGSKRDDRIEKFDEKAGKLVPVNHAVCPYCNMLKGSRPRSAFADIVP